MPSPLPTEAPGGPSEILEFLSHFEVPGVRAHSRRGDTWMPGHPETPPSCEGAGVAARFSLAE